MPDVVDHTAKDSCSSMSIRRGIPCPPPPPIKGQFLFLITLNLGWSCDCFDQHRAVEVVFWDCKPRHEEGLTVYVFLFLEVLMEVQSGYWGDPVERPHGKGMVLKLYKKRSSTVSWPSWTQTLDNVLGQCIHVA